MVWYLYLLIYCARIMDVSIGTMRTICMVRGLRKIAVLLGFFEVIIWVLAVQYVLRNLTDPFALIAYGAGFSTGIAVGMTIERRLARGDQAVRANVPDGSIDQAGRLRAFGYRVTRILGEGRGGPVEVQFIVVPRRNVPQLMERIFTIDPRAMVTVEDIVTMTNHELRLAGEKEESMWMKLIKFK